MSERRCLNPACGAVLDPVRVERWDAKTCGSSCRAAAHRARHGYGQGLSGPVPVAPVRTGSRAKPPGPQISYHRAVAALAEFLEEGGHGDYTHVAKQVLWPVLPELQQERLRARGRGR